MRGFIPFNPFLLKLIFRNYFLYLYYSMETAEIMNRIEEESAIVDEVIPQTRRYANDMGFDELTLIRRKNEVKELAKLYPNIPEFWIEMAWNFHEKTPKEEQDRIIKEKLFEKPCEVNRMLGGVIKGAVRIEEKEIG